MITDPFWRLSDADYQQYLAMFGGQPLDPVATRLIIAGMDEMIDALTEAREGFWEEALEQFLKERNAYARAIGDPERAVDSSWLAPAEEATPFSLTIQAKTLVPLMMKPIRPMTILVVDDQLIATLMMRKIFDLWPDLFAHYVVQKAGVEVMIPQGTDIILLDEHLDGTTGTEIFQSNRSCWQSAVFASISTTGNCPGYTRKQFALKPILATNRAAAVEFIRFVNELISLVP